MTDIDYLIKRFQDLHRRDYVKRQLTDLHLDQQQSRDDDCDQSEPADRPE